MIYRKLLKRICHVRISRKQFLVGGGVFFSLIAILIQWAIPPDFVMPRTKIEGQSVGFTTRKALKKRYTNEAKSVTFQFDSRTEHFMVDELGLSPDVDATIAQLPTVSITDRFIPLMPLYKLVNGKTVKPVMQVDTHKSTAFAEQISQRLKKDPKNAHAEIKNGKLAISKDELGYAYSKEAIAQGIINANPFAQSPVMIESEETKATIQEKEVSSLKDEFAKKTSQPLHIKYGDKSQTIGTDALGTMLTPSRDEVSGKWSLVLNPRAVDEQIQGWAKDYNIAPGISQVSYYDDVETSRKNGAPGRALDSDGIKAQFTSWFNEPKAEPITLVSKVVGPKIVATRLYSRSSAQLQAKLNAWIASHNGRYQVAIQELGGRGRQASYNVAQQTVMASTYKTFLAFAAYSQAESGALDLNAGLTGGRNIEQCIEVMIVNSDNDCPIKLGQLIGWAKVDQIIAAAGFQGTKLNNYNSSGGMVGDKLVNAQEQAKFLAQLSNGSLMSPANTNKLLNYMKRQTYRNGIPAGSRGAMVADKVGFLDGYIHDVGIVYGSKSTYALVIMSDGSSWANIRDLSQAIYDFMNE